MVKMTDAIGKYVFILFLVSARFSDFNRFLDLLFRQMTQQM